MTSATFGVEVSSLTRNREENSHLALSLACKSTTAVSYWRGCSGVSYSMSIIFAPGSFPILAAEVLHPH